MSIVFQSARSVRIPSAIAVGATILLGGCGPRSEPITKISIACPGFSAEQADELVASPLNNAIAGVPHVWEKVALSYPGRVEIYVTWESAEHQEPVAKGQASVATLLPTGSAQPIMTALPAGSVIPSYQTGEGEVILIHFDPDKLASSGVSSAAAIDAAKHVLSAQDGGDAAVMERIESQTVRNADGREIPFKDIATVDIGTEPKCVVRR